MPCLGGLLREEAVAIPERHLGLVTREDHPLDDRMVQRLADLVEEQLDIEALIAGLPEDRFGAGDHDPTTRPGRPSAGPEIGVARDNAFCFYYPDNLETSRKATVRTWFFFHHAG